MKTESFPSKWAQVAVLFLLAVVIFLPRVVNLVDYGTADEPLYLKQSANFYTLLREGRFEETDLIVHPGVPSLWSGALGFWLYFPEYIEDDRSGYPVADLDFRRVLNDHGIKRKLMLAIGRAVSIGIQTGLLVMAFYLGWNVFGFWPSLFVTLLVSFDPFYFANSRILQPDGMQSACMYLAMVACLSYLNSRSWFSLLVSGIAAGLAVLSKVPSIVLIPLVAGLFLVSWWRGSSTQHWKGKSPLILLRAYLVWLGIVLLVIFALWPVMWVDPGGAISQLVSFTSEASSEVNSPMFFNGDILPEGEFGLEYAYFYPLSFLWRTTPVILLGLLLGLASWLLTPKLKDFWKENGFSALVFLLSALIMIFFFTLSAKKFDRYILAAIVYLDVVAAFGYLAFFSYLRKHIASIGQKRIGVVVMSLVVVLLQGWMVAQSYPYYHSYYNPLLGGLEKAPEVMMVGWGEGLNEAAEYLNRQPKTPKYKKVVSWYSATLDFHFETVSQEIPISGPIDDELMAEFLEGEYIVIYISQRQRQSALRLLEFLENKPAEHIIDIEGVPYVWIYNVKDVLEQADK